jgi:spermidine synthase
MPGAVLRRHEDDRGPDTAVVRAVADRDASDGVAHDLVTVQLKRSAARVDDTAVEAESAKLSPVPVVLPRSGTGTLALFAGAIFLSAALVFAVQPMVAKMLLPAFGGAPAVWAVSLVFFQAVLLAGYAFAHLSLRVAGVRRQPLLQLGLLLVPLATLPIAISASFAPGGGGDPHLHLLWALAVTAGLPFFVVTTTSPVLQRWFSAVGHATSADPYFLYAAGNAGSLLALLAYPTLIEPHFTLSQQARLWTLGYSVFVVLAALSAWRVLAAAPEHAPAAHVAAPPLSASTRLRWVAMAALPSSLMVGTTTYLTTNVAAVPLLWVIPLGLYLLSFVIAFGRRQRVSVRTLSAGVVVSSLAVVASTLPVVELPIWAVTAIHGTNLFLVALLVHRRLALVRPSADRLTEFYLLLSLGGVCGGAFNALVAPAIFTTTAEYPIAIVLALFLRPGPRRARPGTGLLRRQADLLLPFAFLVAVLVAVKELPWAAVPLLLGAVAALGLFAPRPVRFALGVGAMLLITAVPQPALHSERTFFGVLRVVEDGDKHVFVHGTTVHGVQSFRADRRREPLSYYTRGGPLGQLFAAMDARPRDVAAIGLGSGAAAAYGRDGDRFTFYEIDPAVVRIASDPRWFTYLRDSKADVRVVVGDGRLEIAHAPAGAYDLIVLDAFSSDAVPVHLLTREALELYLRKLAADGVIVFHVSNDFLDLEPVVAGVARSLGLTGRWQHHLVTRSAARAGEASSIWIVVARDTGALRKLATDRRWQPLTPGPVWTDESSNILDAVKW